MDSESLVVALVKSGSAVRDCGGWRYGSILVMIVRYRARSLFRGRS